MIKTNAEAIGQTLGRVKQVDTSPNGECQGCYLRVRVYIDIKQPLCRGQMVNFGDSQPQWVSFFSMSAYLSFATDVAYSIMMRKIVHYG